jgi:transcriptional regulator with XRE-family HTH domain
MDLLQAFGIVLKQLRTKKALSQEELAHRSSLDRTYISLLERGLRSPTINTLFALCRSLEINSSQFIAEIETILMEKERRDNE